MLRQTYVSGSAEFKEAIFFSDIEPLNGHGAGTTFIDMHRVLLDDDDQVQIKMRPFSV